MRSSSWIAIAGLALILASAQQAYSSDDPYRTGGESVLNDTRYPAEANDLICTGIFWDSNPPQGDTCTLGNADFDQDGIYTGTRDLRFVHADIKIDCYLGNIQFYCPIATWGNIIVGEGTNVEVTGDLNAGGGILAFADLLVSGKMSCHGDMISYGDYISADEIVCGRNIEVSKGSIITGIGGLSAHNITVSGRIDCEGSIFAYGYVQALDAIDVKKDLTCGGSLESGRVIRVNGDIVGGDFIFSHWAIKAGGSITSHKGISASNFIEAGSAIDCGGDITAGYYPDLPYWVSDSRRFDIQCKELKHGHVVMGSINIGDTPTTP